MSQSILSLLVLVMLNRSLYVAADLGIAEYLAQQPMTIAELAHRTNSETTSLQRMMHFLELHGVFNQQENEQYHLTPFSETMCEQHPHSIKSLLLHDDEMRWNSFGHLGYSIATGNASFDKLYDMDYFESLKHNPQLGGRFNDAMMIISSQEDDIIAQQLLFEKAVADIGGGTGQLLNKIIAHNDISKGILYDLPEVIAQSVYLESPHVKYAGSFFDQLSFTADTFVLKRVLHDWNDEKALKILKNIRNAMHSDSKLYIIEGVLDYSENKKLLAAIDLALLTVFKGRERTVGEFDRLIKAAGLEIVAIQNIDSVMCALECRKV